MATMSSFSTSLYGSTISSIVGNVNDAFSGKTSGINVTTVVSELMQLERQPEIQLQNQQSAISSQISALNNISTQLTALYTSVNNLKDIFGAFSQNATGSSDSAVVSATADRTAAAGTHTVTVSRLATTSSSYSGYIASGTSLAGSQIVVKYGSDPNNPVNTDTINIPAADTTLQQAASYINSGSFGVKANVVTDSQGSRLVFVSKTSGANGNLAVSSAATSFTTSAGVDAQLTVDGVPVDSSTNTVTGAIPGVTLSLGAADANSPVLISVQPDTTVASQAIQDFVTAYNDVMGSINSQYTLGSSGNEGVLAGDSMLRTLQSSLLSMVSQTVSGAGQYINLQSMGIEMQNDGTLQFNSANLSQALSSNFSDVQKFFQSTSGWGQAAGRQMLQITDPTLGPVASDINGLKQTTQSLTNQINDFEVRMATVQDKLTMQYSNLNALLQQYPMQMQQIAAQLGSLPDATSSKG
jgi:flagellar hook-associated protein 2